MQLKSIITVCFKLKATIKQFMKYNRNTSAGIRTRVLALATPGDNRYTTDVLRIGAQTRT